MAHDPPTHAARSSWWWDALLFGLLVVIVAGGVWATTRPLPDDCGFHLISQFSGSTDEFTEQLQASPPCRELDQQQAEESLVIDTVYAVFYGVALCLVTRRWWSNWRNSRMRKLRAVAWLGLFAAGFDIIENVVTYTALTTTGGGAVAVQGDAEALFISCVATVKWTLFVLAVLAALASAWAALAPRVGSSRSGNSSRGAR